MHIGVIPFELRTIPGSSSRLRIICMLGCVWVCAKCVQCRRIDTRCRRDDDGCMALCLSVCVCRCRLTKRTIYEEQVHVGSNAHVYCWVLHPSALNVSLIGVFMQIK